MSFDFQVFRRFSIFAAILVHASGLMHAATIDFSDLSLGSNSFWNGSTGAGAFNSGGANFNNYYDSTWDSWSGWSYSNITDNTTAGYGNQYSAIAGGGAGGTGSIYAVANSFSPNDAYINLPGGSRIGSLTITNATYAYFSMLNGDQFAKKFGGASGNDPDFFFLTVTGYDAPGATGNATGSVDFYLADYRFADNSQDYIVSSWSSVDLSSLNANTASLGFGLTSSDTGVYGMNTPAYFALGAVQLVSVPEPGSLVLLGLGLAAGLAMRKRNQG